MTPGLHGGIKIALSDPDRRHSVLDGATGVDRVDVSIEDSPLRAAQELSALA